MAHTTLLTWAVFAHLFLAAPCQVRTFPPVVRVRQGLVKGSTMTSLQGRSFSAYRGIPYARPPVGELRFAPPEEALPWTGVLLATKDGAMCIQKNYLIQPIVRLGAEDCMFINVYTPRINASGGLLDVMVFIHGGGFFSGTGASDTYGPQFLMDKDVVLVTFNYRVGALGFLSTGDVHAPGNYGLKDQVAALRWVKYNIEGFGGNPQSVTIFGQSAGASSVHYHMLSPMSRGLFHRAISQSGTALCKFALPVDGRPLADKQARLVGCPNNDTAALVSCLRRVDAADIVESGDHFHTWSVDPLNVFGPAIETNTSSSAERFLPESPYCIIKKKAFSFVPWIQGVVLDEGLVRVGPIVSTPSLLADLNANLSVIGPMILQLRESSTSLEVADAIWRNISAFYLNGDLPITQSNVQGFLNVFSDRSFKYGSHQASVLHAAAGHSTVYNYHFTYHGNKTFNSLFAPNLRVNYGPCHCDDLLYLFKIFGDLSRDDPDYHVMDAFVTMWTNFAKNGNPTEGGPGLENITEVRWEPVGVPDQTGGEHHIRYLSIDPATGDSGSKVLRLHMREDLEKDRSDFWQSAPIEENSCGGCC